MINQSLPLKWFISHLYFLAQTLNCSAIFIGMFCASLSHFSRTKPQFYFWRAWIVSVPSVCSLKSPESFLGFGFLVFFIQCPKPRFFIKAKCMHSWLLLTVFSESCFVSLFIRSLIQQMTWSEYFACTGTVLGARNTWTTRTKMPPFSGSLNSTWGRWGAGRDS